MVEVIHTTDGKTTTYNNLNDARAKIATQQKIGVDQIRMERINEGPNNGKYIYKVLIKTKVLHGVVHIDLYTEKNTVRSLIDAYLEKFDLYDDFIILRASGTVINIGTLQPNTPISSDHTYIFQLKSSYLWYTHVESDLKKYYEKVVRKLYIKDNLSPALRKEVDRIYLLLLFLENTYVSFKDIQRMDESIKTINKKRSPRQTNRYSLEDELLNIAFATKKLSIIKREISNIVERFVEASQLFSKKSTKNDIINKNREHLIEYIVAELNVWDIVELDEVIIDTMSSVLQTDKEYIEKNLQPPSDMSGESKNQIQLRF